MWMDVQSCEGTKLQFDGVPFMILGKATLACQHGGIRKTNAEPSNVSMTSYIYGTSTY